MAKLGAKPKYDVKASEDLHIRMTASQKQLLFQASRVTNAGTVTDFIQGITADVAPLIIELYKEKITPAEFKAQVAEIMYVLASPSPSPSPEPPEGEE